MQRNKKINVSQSQIGLFRKCPYAYALRYKFKKESIFWDPTLFEVGSRVHDAISTYYKNHYLIEAIDVQIRDKVYEILRNEWDITLPADQLKKAYTCICNFSSFEFNNLIRGGTKPLTECKIYADGMMGIIDYIDFNTNKLVDFKTNSRAGMGYSYKMQAVMYKLLAKHKFNMDITHFGFMFLYPGEWRMVKFDEKTDEIANEILEFRDKIHDAWETGEFPKMPKSKYTCNNCEYRFYCKSG